MIKLLLSKEEMEKNDKNDALSLFTKLDDYSNHLCDYQNRDVVIGIISDLINSGADPNVISPSNESLLMTLATEGCVDVVKVLLNATGIDVNAKDDHKNTALMYAMESYDYRREEVIKLLLSRNETDVNAQDESGATALMWAINRKSIISSGTAYISLEIKR